MGGLLAGLAALAQPILARVLLALGFSVVTTTGVNLIISKIQDLVLVNLGNGVEAALQLAGLAGVWTGLGMVWGSVNFALAYWSMSKAVRLVGAT